MDEGRETPVDVRAHYQKLFEGSSKAGIIDVGETELSLTPLGVQCLDELLFYLSQHPRPDVSKRATRLRDALHRQ